MFVPAPTPVRHAGLQDVVSSLSQVIDLFSQIDQDNDAITNPISTNQQRAAAYLDFSNIKGQLSAISNVGQADLEEIDGKFKTYLQSIVILVPHAYTGLDDNALQFNGRDATAWDIVQAINTKDASADFTIQFPSRDTYDWDFNHEQGNFEYDASINTIVVASANVNDLLANLMGGSSSYSTNPSALADLKAAVANLND